MNASDQKVVKFAQEMLLQIPDRAGITPTIILEKIQLVMSFLQASQPGWGQDVDYGAVTDELIRRFSQWIGKDSTLQSGEGHIPWLTAARKQDWLYWLRYREWLERKLSFVAVDALDQSTDWVLGLLEDPQREGSWDRRGLVVGHVQSGKTSHYTGLINKAADAGYKIVIVLAGLHNNLRAQTQIRLDEGFLGYETGPVTGDTLRVIGVGEINSDPDIRPNFATNRSQNGDFNTKVAQHFGISPERRPWLFVVKKNKTVLKRLLGWIHNHVANTKDQETGRKIVTHLPLLLIDDEADHASVDTGTQIIDEQGHPDPQHEPTAINRLVRQILHTFRRSAYVGYTATPFANIFIHERGATTEEGPDLFPAGFIINLAAPSNYVGPARVFGLRVGDDRESGLPLIRELTDYAAGDGTQGWMPQKHKSSHIPRYQGQDSLPPSLVEAIDAFLLSCAVRQLRGQGREHASMLVHVTRFTAVQKQVARQIEAHRRHIRQRLQRQVDHLPLVERLATLWERDFVPTGAGMNDDITGGIATLPPWSAILAILPEIIEDVQVRTINGTAKDALDYVEHQGTGLKVIAIGGDKLARGLTLEGLSVSYFLRASRMYDTLMQMGRWFGYRPGYLDVCRLYTTGDLIEWFGHIADASEELRQEFDLMAESGGTPRDYGLRVQSHPVLMVTSPLKMRTAHSMMLSFSGCILETVALYRDMARLQHNLAATQALLNVLALPDELSPERWRNGSRQSWEGSFLWNAVSHEPVIEFLTKYQTHPAARKVNGDLLAEFIGSMAEIGELTSWTVALIGGDGKKVTMADGLEINMLKRARKGEHPDRYSIGRLLSPRDEAIDLDEAAWLAALAETQGNFKPDPGRLHENQEPPKIPSGPAIRKIRGFGAEGVPAHPERGLLMLYPLDPQHAQLPDDTPPVIAFGISFPGSHAGRKVEYKVNNVLWEQWEQEYGAAE